MTALEAPEVATFKMVGIKKLITVSNTPKNWSIERETKLDDINQILNEDDDNIDNNDY